MISAVAHRVMEPQMDGQRRRKRGGQLGMCLRGRRERKEPFNSGGHLKDRSGFLVVLSGFCGSLVGAATLPA